jgi:hypothetical protein
MNVTAEADDNKRQAAIYTAITEVADFIIDYLNSEELSHIFINLPTQSGEYIKNYMSKIIDFFKSYKLSILDIQTIYKLDRENKISIFDDIFYHYYFIKSQVIKMIDEETYIATLPRDDRTLHIWDEKWRYFYEYHWKEDFNKLTDMITRMKANFDWNEKIDPEEIIDIYRKYDRLYNEIASIRMKDTLQFSANISKGDSISIEDSVFINAVY